MDLVTGPFRPALEDAFGETLARLRAEDPVAPLAVVAPSKRLADHLKKIALRALPDGFAGVRFFNLFSFARTLYDEAESRGFTVLEDDLVPRRLVATILRRHFSKERYLSRAAISPGAILGALHELKAAAVRPDDALVMLAFQDLGLEDAPKLAEILSLYKRYAEELRRRKLHERSDVVRAAADAAPSSAWLGSLKHVLYYGFYELDQNQIDLFTEVRRRVATTVFFPYADTPDYAYARDFLETIVAPHAGSARVATPAAPAPRITRIAASGAHDEAWAAVKEILRLADQGIAYDEIGLVARMLDPYLDPIESILREHRIPFTSSARRGLNRDPQMKSARLLFSLAEFNRADVMDLLRSPFFRREGGRPELWDRASRLMGVGHGADEWRRRLGGAAGNDYTYSAGEREDPRRFVLPRAEVDLFWKTVEALLEAPPPPESWKEFAEWALARYRRFLVPDARVEQAIETLAALEGFMVDDPLGTLLQVLADLSTPAGGKEGVQVLDAMSARGLSFRALIVLGMNERVFPRHILEDPFIRDAVRSRIVHRLGNRMPRKLEGYDEERLLFTLLLGSADQVVLCHQRSDEKGRLQLPSAFLPPGDPRQIARRPAQRLSETPLELLTPREASLRTGQGEALGRAMGWDVSMLVEASSFIRAIESREKPTPYDGVIDASDYWRALASHGISPTALERLAECPHRYFASKVLGLEELPEPEGEEEVLPVEIGQIYHDVLERTYKGGELEKEIDSAFSELEARRTIRYPLLWGVVKERIRKVLRAFVEADDLSTFTPAEFEWKVRGELPLSVGGRRGVMFRGYVDRMDRGPGTSFRVVDYKRRRSSKFKVTMETGVFKRRTLLQAPIYFLLAQQALGKADVENSRFVYAFIEDALDGDKWELVLDSEFWERRGELDAMLAEILETIPRGEFVIRPGDHCAWCEFRPMCRRAHLPTRWRAEAHHRKEGEEPEEA